MPRQRIRRVAKGDRESFSVPSFVQKEVSLLENEADKRKGPRDAMWKPNCLMHQSCKDIGPHHDKRTKERA